ncbi:hypothetical protein [Hyphococcus lacteus]|uniref:Uncharacterized protein n=1 Tax=Hyphococcus lacteus TaxID=3143536 RepID=A0ABV3Z3P0_9PROT
MNKQFLSVSAVALTLLVPNVTFAQEMNPIDNCRENTDGKKDRIACLEAALRTYIGDTNSIATADSSDQVTAMPNKDQPTGLGAEQVVARNQTISETDAKNSEKDVIASLTDFAVTRSGTYVFFLDNGQIWKQKPADSNRFRLSKKRDYTVKVSQGALSGYRLEIEEMRRSMLVERIK